MTSAPVPTPQSGPLLPFYRISTVLEEPYVFREDQVDGTPRYTGFIIDVLNELAGAAGFDYAIHLARDGTYGSMQRNGSWSGIIGDVQRGDADIAAGAITVTTAREKVIDFTKPVLSTGVQLLVKKPERLWPGLGILVEPFTTELWFLILIFFIIVSFLMFLIGRFSPYEWGRVAAEGDKRGARHTLTLRNSFLLIFSSITWQGYREAPRSLSGRVLAAFWWIFSLFGIVAFTANLTAFLMARGESLPDMPFSDYRDLAKSDIRVGVLQSGSTLAQIQRTTIPDVNSLYVHIREQNSFVTSYAEGIERVKEGEEKFVMLMESVTARYVASNNCELMVYGDSLFERSLAFGCRKNTDICARLSHGILRLREDGTMQLLFDKYWQGKCGATQWKDYAQKVETPIRAYSVSSRDLAVSFLLLFVGIVLAIVLLIAEIVIFKIWGTKEKPIPDIPKPIIKFPAKVPQFRKKKGEAAAVTEVDETKAGEGTAAEGETDAGETTPLRSEGEPAAGAAQSEQAQADEASPTEDQSAADSNEKKAEA